VVATARAGSYLDARAAGMLNHPNILAIYDIGTEEGRHYIVSELLEGESLRARIREGPIPPRKAVDYAQQIARGLAAAHGKGIIHRDLKPENLFLTRDGHVKILDFGLVKLMPQRLGGLGAGDDGYSVTLPGSPTEPGRIVGTVGYIAPEQIRGGRGDHRSDIFAFGAIVHEMLTGKPPYARETPVETLTAILKDEPPEFGDLGVRVPDALERVVRHCLEKNPDERFQSARDLAFDLGAISGLTSQAISFTRLPRIRWRRMIRPLAAVVIGAVAILAAFALGQRYGRRPPPTFHRLTFRTGTVLTARFTPDGQTIWYSARWGGARPAIYSVRAEATESRDLGLDGADVLAISRDGVAAISLGVHSIGYLRYSGTLAQVPVSGGAPRELASDVEAADWTPDGRGVAVVRSVKGRARLEYPIGRVLYDTAGWISSLRFSPDGQRIAFADHPFLNDDRGNVAVIDLPNGKKRTLSADETSVHGVAWNGGEIWFAAGRSVGNRSLYAVTLHGRERLVATSAETLTLHDITHDGRVLVTSDNERAGIVAMLDGQPPRDLSWLDYSIARDLSSDGKTIVFSESGAAGGSIFGIYLRRTDGSPAIRLGDGTTEALSPDGRWVLSVPRTRRSEIVMLPTGPGQPRVITHDTMIKRNARWLPDGKRILYTANETGQDPRIFIVSIDGGHPLPITPPLVIGALPTPDGMAVLGRAADRKFYLFPIAGGTPRLVSTLQSGDVPVRFADDGRSLFVTTFGKMPALLTKVDLATGARTAWKEAMPADTAGLMNVGPILVTPDGKNTVYSYTKLLSDLYLMEP
jgi:Tol biopolymer transport system component